MDELREELTTLGQRIVLAEVQREDAIARVAALWREHREQLTPDDLGRWTTLSGDLLETLAPDRDRSAAADQQ